MSIVFFGTPTFAVPSLMSLMESEEVSAVVTQRDKRRGRRGKPTPSPVKEIALDHGMKVLEPQSMKDESFVEKLRAINPEFIVVVAYGKILSRAVLDAPSIGPINLHASLLPRYRGASPIAWAIINGERETGITTMFITEKLDEGDIILQEHHTILDDDTTETLGRRLAEAGGPLLVRTLKGLRDGTLKGIPQQVESNYAPMFKKEDGRVDWSKSAQEIYNRFRGMYPWPGTYCFIEGKRVNLLKIRPRKGDEDPGKIMQVATDYIVIGTGQGLIMVEELQPADGKAMPVRSFLQGRPLRKGMVVS